jgi:hypothetical protein
MTKAFHANVMTDAERRCPADALQEAYHVDQIAFAIVPRMNVKNIQKGFHSNNKKI